MPTTIDDLPPELFFLIADFGERSFRDAKDPERRQFLLNLTLVARRWRVPAETALWRRLVLDHKQHIPSVPAVLPGVLTGYPVHELTLVSLDERATRSVLSAIRPKSLLLDGAGGPWDRPLSLISTDQIPSVQALHLARSLHDDTPDAGLSEGLAFPPLISLALDFHFWIYEAIGPLLKASRKTLRHLELFSLAHGMSEDVDALTSHLPIVLPTLHSLHIDDIWRGPLLDLVRLATSLTTLSIPNFDDLSRIAPLLPTATVTDIVLRGGWLEASSTLETLRCPSLANLKRVRFTMEARSSSRDQAGFRAVEALLLARGVTLEWDRQDNVVDGKEGAVPDCLPQGGV